MNSLLASGAVLADEAGKGGPSGLFVVIALSVATYFLIRSMSRHLKKVPPTFDEQAGDGEGQADASETPEPTNGDRPV